MRDVSSKTPKQFLAHDEPTRLEAFTRLGMKDSFFWTHFRELTDTEEEKFLWDIRTKLMDRVFLVTDTVFDNFDPGKVSFELAWKRSRHAEAGEIKATEIPRLRSITIEELNKLYAKLYCGTNK